MNWQVFWMMFIGCGAAIIALFVVIQATIWLQENYGWKWPFPLFLLCMLIGMSALVASR